MHITVRDDYAVQAMLAIAADGGGPVKTIEMATRQNIPVTYLPPILTDLRNAELITSRQGSDGGYSLARPATDITVGDIMRAVSGPLSSIRRMPPDTVTYDGAATSLPGLWAALRHTTHQLLDSTTLHDLLHGEGSATAA
ncbi:Rrf2 family transcriptional regulator [Longispora sp. NPDC051575]|uniref:RrF2 family transcriptional regulator n=1 Tax=Longispora sp. NPDC051575 TaxID=3154943 RepID=UPI0034434ABA